jgi:hypothetical protein
MPPQRRDLLTPGPGGYQPDIAQFGALARAVARGEIPFGDVISLLDNHNVPPQLKQTIFMKTIASAASPPALLIPTNKNRMSFIICFIDSGLVSPSIVLLSYGAPAAPNIGIPILSPNNPYGESNGTISIDALYVSPFNNANNATTYPATVFGWEGTLAIESHLHRQTSGGGR